MSKNNAKNLLDPTFIKECNQKAERLAHKRPVGTLVVNRTKHGITIEDSEFDRYTNFNPQPPL